VRYMTGEAIVMWRGDVVERGPTEQLFSAPGHAYTRVLVASARPRLDGPDPQSAT
jgi:peptide/nickel transport system ATP-binding protein